MLEAAEGQAPQGALTLLWDGLRVKWEVELLGRWTQEVRLALAGHFLQLHCGLGVGRDGAGMCWGEGKGESGGLGASVLRGASRRCT